MVKGRKEGIVKATSILLAVIALLALAASESRAFPYRPVAALSILSEYPASKDSTPPHTQVWKVVPEVDSDGVVVLRFLLEASMDSGTICELRLPPPGTDGEIQWKGVGKSGQKIGTGMLLVPGFPAPCDILPVSQGASGSTYEERIEVGGRVFSKRYRVSFAAFSIGDAKAKGWIRAEETGATGLIMVAVTDESGRPVVKQLWPAGGGSWWLYEETPLRRSWLIQ